MKDLFTTPQPAAIAAKETYTAQDIEVLEGLEPVRRRPGMYIGGTDENALHHLIAEVLDNAMDEAVAGHASRIEIEMTADGFVTIRDNGRGIPVDPHPKFPEQSALEVILTTLHSGGKFSNKAYQTSGGLHGVGLSVVNALADLLEVEVVRDRTIWQQTYSRGAAQGKLKNVGTINNRRGTSIRFHPDPEIFGDQLRFKPKKVFQMAKSKAYLFRGVEIRWECDPSLLTGKDKDDIPTTAVIHFPGGLEDFLLSNLAEIATVTDDPFVGLIEFPDGAGKVEWAIHWCDGVDGSTHSYCNTIPTPQGGTHESGLRSALLKSIRAYGEMTNSKKAALISGEDIFQGCQVILSVFIRDPQFQGQTKEKLVTASASKLVENALRDQFDHWLSGNTQAGTELLEYFISQAEERLNRKKKDVSRKAITKTLRLPGKLADCSREIPLGTELFIVEGDSAGGSAKQARNRETQAILPIRGKILNVASASLDKIQANQELADIELALGCGTGDSYNDSELRYEKIIIMTDADVDGAHIATLLMTYFFLEMPELIRRGHLFLAQPPLYRLVHNQQSYYAQSDAHKDKIMKDLAKKRGNVEISRFKGLGEMTPPQLKETTMNIKTRNLWKVELCDYDPQVDADQVNTLMGKKPELRFQFIQEQAISKGARLVEDMDV